MDTVNFHHLRYFWLVAREGGIVSAAKLLRLTHPTLSAQIHALEEAMGEKLFHKVGRRLELTESGRVAYRYADEIFALGTEMVDTLHGRATGKPVRLNVGIADVVPKLVVRQMLEPALSLAEPVRLVCYEESHSKLLADLATHALDLVISDSQVPAGSSVRAFNHQIGETTVALYATRELVKRYRRGFPESLNNAPFLLPLENLPLRRALNLWFDKHDIQPKIVAEFEDSALLKVFGADGVGIFPAPTVVGKAVETQYGVAPLGIVEGVRERFYAISMERRLRNPAVVAILESARHALIESPVGRS